MSQQLHLTSLWWDGHSGRGLARHDGVAVELKVAPDVGIAHLRQLEFSPAVRVAQARCSAEAMRELSREERGACQAFLDRLASAARAVALMPLESHL